MMMPYLYQRLHQHRFYHRRPREFRGRRFRRIRRLLLVEAGINSGRLLAFWSMLTGTVNIRWSAGNIDRFSDDFRSHAAEDLDVLDTEEREKLVKHMWDVYMNSKRVALPSFWKDAFVAAYEDLTSEVPEVQEAAITEIARMSIHYNKILPARAHSSSSLIGQPRFEARG